VIIANEGTSHMNILALLLPNPTKIMTSCCTRRMKFTLLSYSVWKKWKGWSLLC